MATVMKVKVTDSIKDQCVESCHEPGTSIGKASNSSHFNDKGSHVSSSEIEGYSDIPQSTNDGYNKHCYRQPQRGLICCMQAMQRTNHTIHSEGKGKEIQRTLRELIIYIIFLAIVMILTFGMISTSMYWYTKVLTDLFVDTPFEVDEESVIINSLYGDFWYDQHRPAGNIYSEDGNILYENKLLGLPRLRQVKVRNDSCIVHEDFQRVFKTCYDFYSYEAEDTEPFGPRNGTAWTHFTEKELYGYNHRGVFAIYGGGGYYEDLSLKRDETIKQVRFLKENLWVTRGTRAIFLDLNVYNANINLFCIIKLIFEIPPTGGVIPSSSFRTVRLLRYVKPFDYFVLVCEYIFVAFIIFYSAEEVREMAVLKLGYLSSLWNILDLAILMLAYVLISFSIYRYFVIRPMINDILGEERFTDFDFIGSWQFRYNNATAVMVFFVWIKLFKYVKFNKAMSQLSMTLSRCAKDIAGFAVMFFVVFIAFVQLGYLLFGTQVEDFRSFGTTVFTLLRTILGDFNYPAITEANHILGPIFFLSYIFFVYFILLNMFLAIINDTYSDVKAEISTQHSFVMSDYMKQCFGNMMRKLGCKSRPTNRAPTQDNYNRTCSTIRNVLRKHNFTDLEIGMFFAKYDINEDKEIEKEETMRILMDLEGRHVIVSTPASKQSDAVHISKKEFLIFQNRVHHMEDSITAMIDKIEAVLTKLDAVRCATQQTHIMMGNDEP